MSRKNAVPKSPTHIAYVVRQQGKTAFWDRIGSAWPHQDGDGFNIQLNALPIDGRIVLRLKKENEAEEGGAA